MPGPVMPMDVAMRFYISQSPPPLRGFLSSYEDLQRVKNCVNRANRAAQNQAAPLYKPLRPCLSLQKGAEPGGVWTSSSSKKKRVVFADSKGMSLTAVRVFSKFDDEPFRGAAGQRDEAEELLQFHMSDLQSDLKKMGSAAAAGGRSLALDFKQPSADYLDFRNRLIRNGVCLENCSLQERALTGTVKVRNTGFRKAVALRVTFDSWASFSDFDCSFMNNVYGCQDTDTFAFALELPAAVAPAQSVEFCVRFEAQDGTHWDNNDGANYVLKHVGCWSGEESAATRTTPAAAGAAERSKQAELKDGGMKLLDLDLDQFGSPRMSSGLFPGWQSWGHIDSAVPYW